MNFKKFSILIIAVTCIIFTRCSSEYKCYAYNAANDEYEYTSYEAEDEEEAMAKCKNDYDISYDWSNCEWCKEE